MSRARGLGLLLAALVLAAPRGHAQGEVQGTITLAEPRTNAKRDVATAVVFLEPARGIAPSGGGHAADATASIAMREKEYLPHVQVVAAGGSVGFPNEDPFSHNVFSNSALGAFDLGLYRHGATRSATFARPGAYAIYCNIHAQMVAYVIAVPGGLWSRVGEDGRFTIPNVPAGSYTLTVWHERAPTLAEAITVGPGGRDKLAVTLDTRTNPRTAHLNKFGQPYAPERPDRY